MMANRVAFLPERRPPLTVFVQLRGVLDREAGRGIEPVNGGFAVHIARAPRYGAVRERANPCESRALGAGSAGAVRPGAFASCLLLGCSERGPPRAAASVGLPAEDVVSDRIWNDFYE